MKKNQLPQTIVDYWEDKGYTLKWVDGDETSVPGWNAIEKISNLNRGRVISIYEHEVSYWNCFGSEARGSMTEGEMINFIRFGIFV